MKGAFNSIIITFQLKLVFWFIGSARYHRTDGRVDGEERWWGRARDQQRRVAQGGHEATHEHGSQQQGAEKPQWDDSTLWGGITADTPILLGTHHPNRV